MALVYPKYIRLSTKICTLYYICNDYVNNNFTLSKDTPNITIQSKENGESISKEYEIAGKKFKKLDEEVQSTLLACSLEFCNLSDYIDDEVKEMFRRQNNGKPLNGKLLRIVHESDEFSGAVYSLATHPFMDKLITKAQRKNGTDRDLIIQTLMLIETNQNNDFTSSRNKDIDVFVMNHSKECLKKVNTLKHNEEGCYFTESENTLQSIKMDKELYYINQQ